MHRISAPIKYLLFKHHFTRVMERVNIYVLGADIKPHCNADRWSI